LKEEEDDLVTLLWQADFAGLRYEYVEPDQDGVDLPGSDGGGEPQPVNAADVRASAAEPSTSINPDDFQDTLYFLDEAELRRVEEEVRREANRDLMGDVLAGLFDRLEDGSEQRQTRIVQLLTELLPSILSSGQFERSGRLLGELVALAGRPGVLAAPTLREVRSIFDHLARPETIQQLVQTLEEQPGALQGNSLGVLLGFFPPASLAPLMRALEGVSRPDVKRALEQAIDRLVEANRDAVVDLIRDPDPSVAAGAARWAGRLGPSVRRGRARSQDLLGNGIPSRGCGARRSPRSRISVPRRRRGRSLLPLLGDTGPGCADHGRPRASPRSSLLPARQALEAADHRQASSGIGGPDREARILRSLWPARGRRWCGPAGSCPQRQELARSR
jgi:hypothetical protein